MINSKREKIFDFYESLADSWSYWRHKNKYYHEYVDTLIARQTPPDSKVLELGCGDGDLLQRLSEKGCKCSGINYSKSLNIKAKNLHPDIDFHYGEIDSLTNIEHYKPDIIIMKNMLDYVYDIYNALESCSLILPARGQIIITASNPLWAPILRLGSKLKIRTPQSIRNFVTDEDLASLLKLKGFDIIQLRPILLLPIYIPLISWIFNELIARLPIIRNFCSTQMIVAKHRKPFANLSCTVVVPCHNEEENINQTILEIPSFCNNLEILVVDDGSTDQTSTVVKKIMEEDSRVKLISNHLNKGKASAVFKAFLAAKGEVLMIMDADAAVAGHELQKFYNSLLSGSTDFVNGTRFVYPMSNGAMKFVNYVGNKFFGVFTSYCLSQRVTDTLCGTKALFKKDFFKMPSSHLDRWGDFTLLFGAASINLMITEMPIHYRERRGGKSKMKAFVEVWIFLAACFRGAILLRSHVVKSPNFNQMNSKYES